MNITKETLTRKLLEARMDAERTTQLEMWRTYEKEKAAMIDEHKRELADRDRAAEANHRAYREETDGLRDFTRRLRTSLNELAASLTTSQQELRYHEAECKRLRERLDAGRALRALDARDGANTPQVAALGRV